MSLCRWEGSVSTYGVHSIPGQLAFYQIGCDRESVDRSDRLLQFTCISPILRISARENPKAILIRAFSYASTDSRIDRPVSILS
jgi:hypothetical protein